MKYMIQFPISTYCNNNCPYCFHANANRLKERAFTVAQFKLWRDKHLADAAEILYELHGGEPHCNAREAFEIIDTLDGGLFQLQTNGLGDVEFYKGLIKRRAKIARVGFTYHRAVIGGNKSKTHKFVDSVMLLKLEGISVYVKELLIPEYRDKILENKRDWESCGVDFRIQDFRGEKGLTKVKYELSDLQYIHPEYLHGGPICECRAGYKNIIIRGYDDLAAAFGGDVLACWHDPVVVGNINDGWYNPQYTVNRVGHAAQGVDVSGVPKIYRGTYPRDLWSQENEKKYQQLNVKQLKEGVGKMNAWRESEVARLRNEMGEIERLIAAKEISIDQSRRSIEKAEALIAEAEAEIKRLKKLADMDAGAIAGFENETRREASAAESNDVIPVPAVATTQTATTATPVVPPNHGCGTKRVKH